MSLRPFVVGRAELFDALAPEVARVDPRRREHAEVIARLRTLDRIGWSEPLGRERPSWVFYDCALVPGAIFGYARDGGGALDPVAMLALIPTIDGASLVQSLAVDPARAGGDPTDAHAHALARTTLVEGTRALGAARLVAAMPWRTPLFARFFALGPLRLHTAWTPAHDEPRTLTFSTGSPATGPALAPFDAHDDDALVSLQAELEAGAGLALVALDAAGAHLRCLA